MTGVDLSGAVRCRPSSKREEGVGQVRGKGESQHSGPKARRLVWGGGEGREGDIQVNKAGFCYECDKKRKRKILT